MSELTKLAEAHGYILVPRCITSTARLEELIRPARECAEAHERLSATKPEIVFGGESQSTTNPEP
jgi:NAD-dependent SIR2 family protein deacetylase